MQYEYWYGTVAVYSYGTVATARPPGQTPCSYDSYSYEWYVPAVSCKSICFDLQSHGTVKINLPARRYRRGLLVEI